VIGRDLESSFQVSPVRHHRSSMDSHMYEALSSKHEMVLHSFGKAILPEAVHSSSSRRLMQSFPSFDDRWVGCHGGSDTDEFQTKVGVATDLSFYNLVSNEGDSVEDRIGQLFATVNQVYRPLFGVILQVSETEIRTDYTDEAWNQYKGDDGQCSIQIGPILDSFNDWRNSAKPHSDMGVWHLINDCFGNSDGVAGLALMGTLCNDYGYNTGVSSHIDPQTWYFIAHEIGHNFGAGHSFEDDARGGIMDYGDGTLDGVYTFNPVYRQDEICGTIQNARFGDGKIPDCFTQYWE